MERRDFLRGVGGLVVVASLAGIAGVVANRRPELLEGTFGSGDATAGSSTVFTTSECLQPEAAVGPVMIPKIELIFTYGNDEIQGFFGDRHLFNVDAAGATLIVLADGSRTLGEITAETEQTVSSAIDWAGVADFFVKLGQHGYLQNQVYVTLYENRV